MNYAFLHPMELRELEDGFFILFWRVMRRFRSCVRQYLTVGQGLCLKSTKEPMEELEMDFLHRCGAFRASIVILWCVGAHADQHATLVSAEDRYDLRRLMHPSAAELASEERGKVHIYDSLEIYEVNTALDRNFERIQNMMFIRIKHLPATGSGPAEVEDDDC